jgi:hypothetical protein
MEPQGGQVLLLEKEIIKQKATILPVPSPPMGDAQVRQNAQPHCGPGWAQAAARSQGLQWSLRGCNPAGGVGSALAPGLTSTQAS